MRQHLLPAFVSERSFVFVWLLCTISCCAQAIEPSEAQKQFEVPDDLRIELVAAEPDVRQPLSIEFDERGRMWVLQYLQYPLPEGLTPVAMDRYLRTSYDKLPEPPPNGPKGADRITIFEDLDGDGEMEVVGNFLDDLNLASGFALGHGGVFVAQPPYLLYYADKNRDDLPDGDAEVLLTGFGMEDSHAFANSLTFGPDGWLYGVQGSTASANINGIEFQQGVWRYHPMTKMFELFAEGGGNTWGLDFDRMGNLFSAGNTVEPLCHHVQGAYHVKGFGKHGPLHNAHTYGYFQPVEHHGYRGDSLTGGFVLYQGGNFPERFHDNCLAPNGRHSAMRWSHLETRDSTFSTHAEGDLITTEDVSFRPVDSTVGPDGALYVADWYDSHLGHAAPNDHSVYYEPQRDNGRIWRLATTNQKPATKESLDLRKWQSQALLDLAVKHATEPTGNIWFTRTARRLLFERRDSALIPACEKLARENVHPSAALEGLWSLVACGGFDEKIAAQLLNSPHQYVRAWTIRLLGDDPDISAAIAARFAELAKSDPSVVVRSQLACTAKRIAAEPSLAIVSELYQHDADTEDVQLPLLIWWAIESKAESNSLAVMKLARDEKFWTHPLPRDFLSERVVRRFAAMSDDAGFALCAELFASASKYDAQDHWISGMNQALAGQRLDATPPELTEIIAKLVRENSDDIEILRLGVALADSAAADAIVERLNTDAEPQIQIIELLGLSQRSEGIPILLDLLANSDIATELKQAALSALRSYTGKTIAKKTVALYPDLDESTAAQTIEILVSRRDWAAVLLDGVAAETIPAEALSADQLRRILSHDDPELKQRIEKNWGSVRESTREEVQHRIAEVSGIVGKSAGEADLANGQALLEGRCAACHSLFGKGNRIGPALEAIERKDLGVLLSNIIDPSAVVRQQYIYHLIKTKDGRVLTGLLATLSPATVTLLDAANQRTEIERADIVAMDPIPVSLMPEGLLQGLSDDDLRDLFAYLRRDKP